MFSIVIFTFSFSTVFAQNQIKTENNNDSNFKLVSDNVVDDSHSVKDAGLEVYDYKTSLPAIENEDYEIDKEASYLVLILDPNSSKVINKDLLVKGSTNNCKISVRNISGTVVFDNVNIDLSNVHANFSPSCLDFDSVKLHFIGNNILLLQKIIILLFMV